MASEIEKFAQTLVQKLKSYTDGRVRSDLLLVRTTIDTCLNAFWSKTLGNEPGRDVGEEPTGYAAISCYDQKEFWEG